MFHHHTTFDQIALAYAGRFNDRREQDRLRHTADVTRLRRDDRRHRRRT